MTTFGKALLWVICAASPGLHALHAQLTDVESGPVAVSVISVTLKDVNADRITFDVESQVSSTRSLTIKRVRFEQMHLGNLPVYLRPVEAKLSLRKGEPLDLPAIALTVYFRDLDSLEPLQRVVREEEASVKGTARVDLDLNFLERFAGGAGITHAEVPIKATTPVEVPGGIFGQTAALGTLTAAQMALDLGGSTLNALRRSQEGWERDIQYNYVPSLVVAESRYTLQTRNGQRMSVAVRSLGFRIAADRFVLTGEMIEPWKYDTATEAALAGGETTLVDDGRDLLVWTGGEATTADAARSMVRGAIVVEHTPARPEATRVVAGSKDVKLQLFRRDSDTNYAVLRFTHPGDKGPVFPTPAPAAGTEQSWDRLMLFRADDRGKLELIPAAAHRQEGRIVLDDPVDESAFGSLLISPDGAVGMVQAESSGMALRSAW